MLKKLLSPLPYSLDWAALLMRLVFCGLMVYNHGLIKITLFSESPESFSDPLGIGASASYYLVVFAEAICSGLVLLGLFTRLALLPLLGTMAVAIFSVNWENPLTDKELPLLYFSVYVAIWLLGPGRFSLDWRLFGKENAAAFLSRF
ncbi:MAG: DoxX family protein [Saprospiraceae bacterium]